MYNRYIRNDNGTYTRIAEEGPPPRWTAPRWTASGRTTS